MPNNSRKRKAFSPLSLTYQSKLAKITKIDPKSNDGSLLSEEPCENDSTQHKVKTFSECSPATQNYVKNTWGSGNVKGNSVVNCSQNISNVSKNPNNTVTEKKIKYIPDCSPMTQNMIANHRVEYLEPQEELDLLTCSTNLSSTPPKLKIANNMQFFSLSDDDNKELQHWEQEKNKENISFYFDSNVVKDSTSPFKLFYSVPSSLSDNNSDRETLLLSGVSFLSISQTSNFEDGQLNFKKFLSQERSKLELKNTSYFLSNLSSEYDEYEKKILCAPKMKIHNYNNSNTLETMNMDKIQQLVLKNIAFLEMDLFNNSN